MERSVNEKEKANILKGINYEDAQSIVFRKPDDATLKIETKKLQFLSNFREACNRGDFNNPENNYITAISSNLITLSAIQDLRREIAIQKKQKFLSSAKKDYLKYTEEYAKYWFDGICSWIGDIFKTTLRTAENSKYNSNSIKYDNIESLPDLYKFIGEKYRGKYTREFNVSKFANQTLEEINRETKGMTKQYIYLDFDPKVMKILNELRKINEKLKNAIKENRGFDVLNLSILGIVKNRHLYSILETKPNTESGNVIMYKLYKTNELYKTITDITYKQIFAHIWLDAPDKKSLTYFKGIYNFE